MKKGATLFFGGRYFFFFFLLKIIEGRIKISRKRYLYWNYGLLISSTQLILGQPLNFGLFNLQSPMFPYEYMCLEKHMGIIYYYYYFCSINILPFQLFTIYRTNL